LFIYTQSQVIKPTEHLQKPTGKSRHGKEIKMNNIDCERFIRGAEEIDRKRRVITRVITTVEALLCQKTVIASHKWKYQETVLKIPIGGLFFVIKYSKRGLDCCILDDQGQDHLWWGSTNYADSIPAKVVPIVYKNLSEIVEKIAEAFPKAGIYSYFEFFSKQVNT